MTILLGNGDGTFTAAASPALAASVEAMAAGDFTGDGSLDLAVGDYVHGNVTIFLGDGKGGFTASSSSTAPSNPDSFFAVGDFNGDGNLDLAITPNSGRTALLLGNGDGTFTPSANMAVAILALGDFNRDGATDAASIVFRSGMPGISLAVQQTSAATASAIVLPAATGAHQLVASYPGDSNYAASTSPAIAVDAGPGTPAVNLAVSPNPAATGTSVTVTATVTGSGLAPTGTVASYDGSVSLGSETLNSSGVATVAPSTFPLGSNSIQSKVFGRRQLQSG